MSTAPPAAAVEQQDNRAGSTDVLWLGFVLTVFLAVNLLTGTRWPTVWVDETLYTDPAANCYFGQGFTSSAWPGQKAGEFWAGNVPLHQFLLTGWFHVFGFGLLAARSMNYALAAVAMAILWLACRRMKLIRTGGYGGFAVALMLCGTGITMSYRSARPDCVTILLAALAFLVFTIPRASQRRMVLVGLGLLFPAAGLQLVVFATLLGTLIVLFTRGRYTAEFIALGTGFILGCGALLALYSYHGVLGNFIAGVTTYADIGAAKRTVTTRLLRLPEFLAGDKCQLGLVVVAVIWLAVKFRAANRFHLRPLVFALIAWFVVTTTMVILGKFPVYYSWMTNIPLVVGLVAVFEATGAGRENQMLRTAAIGLTVLASLPGLPLKCAVTVWRWQARDYSLIEEYVRAQTVALKPAGWFFADHWAYFALKNRSAIVVLPPYLDTISSEEKSKITAAVVNPAVAADLPKLLGGTWKQIGEPLVAEWNAIHNPDPLVRRIARRLDTHPQETDYRLCVYERLSVGSQTSDPETNTVTVPSVNPNTNP